MGKEIRRFYMPFIENPKELYEHALKHKYIIAGFNIFNLESMQAVVEAAVRQRSPVILQLGSWVYESLYPLKKFISYCIDYGEDIDIPMIIHHDHMYDLDMCTYAVKVGFQSIMFDGSKLSFQENIKQTKAITEYAHNQGVWVEAELGSIPGFEQNSFSDQAIYTDPFQAAEFIERTGCDSLSVAVGTAHGGVAGNKDLEIDYNLLQQIKTAVGNTPLVLHGAASLPKDLIDFVNDYGGKVPYLRMASEKSIERTRNFGVAKVNMDVDNMLAYTGELRKFFTDTPEVYNPMTYLPKAKEAFCKEVEHKMKNVVKSIGQADSFWREKGVSDV
jgi:fructose-bisphosphate aldolase class II